MPLANVRGVNIQYEVLGDKGPWVALSPGGRRPLDSVKSLGQRLAAAGSPSCSPCAIPTPCAVCCYGALRAAVSLRSAWRRTTRPIHRRRADGRHGGGMRVEHFRQRMAGPRTASG